MAKLKVGCRSTERAIVNERADDKFHGRVNELKP